MDVPLSSFMDFVLKSGSPRMTCAKKIKAQLSEDYDPATDYYKRFREAVQEMHSSGQDKSELQKIIGDLPESKRENYRAMVVGYKKFLGTKAITWFKPPREIWTCGDLEIPINPEVGLEWNDEKYIVKLYLKADKPSKDRFSSVLALMKHTVPAKNCKHMLLDVRNSKPYVFEDDMLDLIPLVESEAEALSLLLGRLP